VALGALRALSFNPVTNSIRGSWSAARIHVALRAKRQSCFHCQRGRSALNSLTRFKMFAVGAVEVRPASLWAENHSTLRETHRKH